MTVQPRITALLGRLVGITLTTLALSAVQAADSKPVAAVVSVTGTATVVRQGGGGERVTTGLLLARGDTLHSSGGARIQLALSDGTGYEIEGEQRVTIPPPKQGSIRQLTGRAWQAVITKFRSLWGRNTAQAVLAGTRQGTGEPSLRPVQPAPTEGPDFGLQRSKVLAEHPVFLWTNVAGATQYHLCVQRRDGEGQWEQVVPATPPSTLAALVVATPAHLPLEPGGVYRWYVWSEGEESERSPVASFQVATVPEAQEMKAALEQLRSPRGEAMPLDRDVLQGILYEGHGFFADALWAYYRAGLKRPEDRGLLALITELRERSE